MRWLGLSRLPERRLRLGSASEQVVRQSPVPVLLVTPGEHIARHIRSMLVPVDGSPGAELALATALPIARAVFGSVADRVVHTSGPPGPPGSPQRLARSYAAWSKRTDPDRVTIHVR